MMSVTLVRETMSASGVFSTARSYWMEPFCAPIEYSALLAEARSVNWSALYSTHTKDWPPVM